MRRPELAHQLMARLHAAGLRLHIDDFGTGHSSLHAAAPLPGRRAQDRPVLRERDPRGARRARELVARSSPWGARSGSTVIAEGVETLEQLATLRDVGCASAQGFLFDRALPGDRAGALLGPLAGRGGRLTCCGSGQVLSTRT